MKQENKKITVYQKAKHGFYSRVKENEKKERQLIIVASLATLLLASILLFTAALIETSAGKYTYVFGDHKQRIDQEMASSNGIQLIDMNALANYCGFESSTLGTKAEYSGNGTSAVFENGKSYAMINGIKLDMPTKAVIKNGYCLIPLSTAKNIFTGLTITSNKNQADISMSGGKVFIIVKSPEIEYSPNASKYHNYINSTDPYIYTLVNKQNPVDETFPEDKDSLIEIPAEYRKPETIYLYTVAEKALEAMMQDMFDQGFDDVYVTSAYRRFQKQKQLFDMYVEELMDEYGYSYDRAYAEVLKDTAEPGKSEHQTGLCVDFTTSSIVAVSNKFEQTEAFKWLVENSWKYGFVLRYPKDKVDVTGYAYESWHYRFVGFERASIMYQTGLCYEEYLEYFE